MTRLPRTGKPIPDAQPCTHTLVQLVRAPHAADFVWTGAVRLTDGTRVDGFVHRWTRRELLLGDDGAVFRLTPTGRYKQHPDDWIVEWAIPHRFQWLEMGGYAPFDEEPEAWPAAEDDDDDDDDDDGIFHATNVAGS